MTAGDRDRTRSRTGGANAEPACGVARGRARCGEPSGVSVTVLNFLAF